MLRAAGRAFLAVLLVVALAGSGVAFALGVNLSPAKRVCTPSGIPGYGPVCKNKKPKKKKHCHKNKHHKKVCVAPKKHHKKAKHHKKRKRHHRK